MKRLKRGFTLIELIIVIVIIGILALVAIPKYFSNLQKAKRAEAVTALRSLREAEMAYFAKTGEFKDVSSGTPLYVDIDSDGSNDIVVNPRSTNFSFQVSGGDAIATKNGTKSDFSYSMNLETGVVTES